MGTPVKSTLVDFGREYVYIEYIPNRAVSGLKALVV